ncbi:MAG TPA: DUF222 domain-containing protein [Galbitalea sp.]
MVIVEPGTVELDAALTALAPFGPADLSHSGDEQLARIAVAAESLARRLGAIQLAVAAEIADRSRPELGTAGLSARHGCMRPAAFIEGLVQISGADAARRIRLGSALRRTQTMTGELLPPRFPILADAVAAGEIGTEAAAVIVRVLDDARRVADPADRDVAEAVLVDHARINPVQRVCDLAIAIRDRLDPDGILPREEETRARRGLRLGRERNGIVPFSGGAEPTTAALLKSAFDEANAPGATPRFLSEDDRRDGTTTTVADDGTEVVKIRDARTRDQRQYDVFAGLLKAGIRNTGFEAGQIRSTAEVTVHVSLADLEFGAGVGWIDGIHEPVSVTTVERLACDAVFRRAVLGNDGEVLALGKARYPFNSAQRKAIIVRDGDQCLLCDAPATWADTHHVEEYWTHGAVGTTDVDNGVMLCGPHHDFIHHTEWQIAMIGGIPHLLAPPHVDPSQTWKRLGNSRVLHPLYYKIHDE